VEAPEVRDILCHQGVSLRCRRIEDDLSIGSPQTGMLLNRNDIVPARPELFGHVLGQVLIQQQPQLRARFWAAISCSASSSTVESLLLPGNPSPC
jgi:hypothetical protein